MVLTITVILLDLVILPSAADRRADRTCLTMFFYGVRMAPVVVLVVPNLSLLHPPIPTAVEPMAVSRRIEIRDLLNRITYSR